MLYYYCHCCAVIFMAYYDQPCSECGSDDVEQTEEPGVI